MNFSELEAFVYARWRVFVLVGILFIVRVGV